MRIGFEDRLSLHKSGKSLCVAFWSLRFQSYMRILIQLRYFAQRTKMGTQSYHKTNEQTKKEIQILIDQAQDFYMNSQIVSGIARLDQAIYRLAYIHTQEDNMSGTSSSFQQNVDFQNHNIEYLYKLALLYYKLCQFQKCISLVQGNQFQIFQYAPFKIIADCYRRLKRFKEARVHYQRAYKIAEKSCPLLLAQIMNNIGLMQLIQGKLGDAKSSFVVAVSFSPKNALAHCNLARVCTKLGEKAQALEHYKLAKNFFQEGQVFRSLSSKNKDHIRKETSKIQQLIKALYQKGPQTDLLVRKNIGWAKDFSDLSGQRIQKTFTQMGIELSQLSTLDSKFSYICLEGKEPLKSLYKGMQRAYTSQFQTAIRMQKQLVKPTIPIQTLVISNLASMIPYVGSFLQTGIKEISEAQIRQSMKVKANNLINLSQFINTRDSIFSRYEHIMQEVVISVIYSYKEVLLQFQPKIELQDCIINLPGAEQLRLNKQKLSKLLFSSQQQQEIDPFKAFGQVLMMYVIETTIFTGEVYQKIPLKFCKKDDVINSMCQAAGKFLFRYEQFGQLCKIREEEFLQ